jgi:hypothetical protein
LLTLLSPDQVALEIERRHPRRRSATAGGDKAVRTIGITTRTGWRAHGSAAPLHRAAETRRSPVIVRLRENQ